LGTWRAGFIKASSMGSGIDASGGIPTHAIGGWMGATWPFN
jgi:hypothetical protein